MGNTKLKVLKYDKVKASVYFAWFKFLELMAVLLFFTGPYYFGKWIIESGIYALLPTIVQNVLIFPLTYLHVWHFGEYLIATSCVLLCLVAIILWGMLYLINFVSKGVYWLVKAWIKANWKMSTRHAEDPMAIAERLSEQVKLDFIKKVEKKEKEREKYGFCVGDEAKYICQKKDVPNRKRLGQKCKILKIDNEGDIIPLWEDGTNGSVGGGNYIYASSFKFFKQPIPKKPKLSKLRQAEVSRSNKK